MIHNKEINFQLRPEDELMLCCARTQVNEEVRENIISLVNLDLNWEYLIDMASLHRLRPLLYVNLNSICAEDVPGDVLVSLKGFFHFNASKNLLITGELFKIMEILEKNGIDALSYKGSVIASQAYGNLALREFKDIDIFINRKDALIVKEVMMLEGYELHPPIDFQEEEYYLKFITEHIFINKNNGVIIEIKWKFEGDFFSLPEYSNFFNQIYNYNLNGFSVPTFSPENQFLVLAIHSAKHDWTKLSWICDISEFIQKENINWKETVAAAEKLFIKRILMVNIILARDLFDLELSEEIELHINSDSSAKKIALNIKNNIFNQHKESLNLFEKFFLDFKKRENVFYGIKDNFNSFTKPGYRDFNDFPLPKKLFPLYHVIRPFILLRRYGKEPL